MNELEMGIAIEQMISEMTDREITSIEGGPMPDGCYVVEVIIDNKQFIINIGRGDK